MSVSDLIKRGLFAEDFMGNGKKICRLEDFPEEIKYKREKYNDYKKNFADKILFLKNLLIRMSFIATWDKDEKYIRRAGFYFLDPIVLNFNCIIYNLSPHEIFQIIVKLLWANEIFSTDGISLLLRSKNYSEEKITFINNTIEKLANALSLIEYSTNMDSDLKNTENQRFQAKQTAFKVDKYNNTKRLPQENILVCLDPTAPMTSLFKDIKNIVFTELQERNITKTQIIKNGGILSDAEIKEMIGYNILFFLDMYLFSKVYNVNLDGTAWGAIAYNGVLGKDDKEEENNRTKTSKTHFNFMKKNINKVYVHKILQRIKEERNK